MKKGKRRNVGIYEDYSGMKKEIINSLNEFMPYCNQGDYIYNWELSCITADPKVRSNRITQENEGRQWCSLCSCYKKGTHEYYEKDES